MNDAIELLQATGEAEEALLGAILIESTRGTREAINAVSHILSAHEFHGQGRAKIYQAMLQCPLPPHQISVALQMKDMGTLEPGVCSYLCLMVSTVPCSLDYMHYALAVKGYSKARKGLPFLKDIAV